MSDQLSKAESRLWQAKPIMAGYFISGYLIARGDEEPIARTICRDEADDEEASELIVSALNHIESADISKVVEARQIIDEFIQCSNVGRWDGKLVNAAKDWLAATDRLESATTPAEVDDRALSQQARAWEAVFDTLSEVVPGWSAQARTAKELACESIRTLARQLAEAKEGEATRKSEVKYWFNAAGAANTRAEQAESKLVEATRRLVAVEGLLREAAGHMKRGRAYYSEYHDFIERITALTKEPTK